MAVVVVESPAKAKTINKYLGDDYIVLASYGHVRDLPRKDGSVDPEHDFEMKWEVAPESQKHVRAIAEALKADNRLILATDPDREGEAISWHLLEALTKRKAVKKDTQVQRVVFNAITKTAVTDRDGRAPRHRHGTRRRLPRPPRPRLSRRLQPLSRALAQAARREIRRPRPVGLAAPHRPARNGDRGLQGPRILVRQGRPRHPARRHLRGPPRRPRRPQARQVRPPRRGRRRPPPSAPSRPTRSR